MDNHDWLYQIDAELQQLKRRQEIRAEIKDLQDTYREFLTTRGVQLTFETEYILLMIIARKNFLEIYEELPRPSGRPSPQAAELRLSAIELLWGGDLWQEPWISLINQEFPGEPPTDEDFAAFMVRKIERIPHEEKSARQRHLLNQELITLFASYGYVPWPQDEPVISLLIHYIQLAHLGMEPNEIKGTLLEAIQQKTSQPNHPVWSEITKVYILGSATPPAF